MSITLLESFRKSHWRWTASTLGTIALAAILWFLVRRDSFSHRIYRDSAGSEFSYQVFIPADFTRDREWPVILFLHGVGQSGFDGKAQTGPGLGEAICRRKKSFPFIAVFPQSISRTWEADSPDARRALAILDEVSREFNVDRHRVYLTGFSMGGGGTWSLAHAYPDRWAAIAPVCGYGNPEWAPRLKSIPCWCFHGARDQAVSVGHSRQMVMAIQAEGDTPRYSEFSNLGHDWKCAYENDELYDWLLTKRRRPTKQR